MTARTPISRTTEVPDLVGVRADQAVERLREFGLLPVMWSAEVDDAAEAGVVLGVDPPAGSPVRPTAMITMCVAAHRDFQGQADDSAPGQAAVLVEATLTKPIVGDRLANSSAERRGDLPQRRERGGVQVEMW